jgi:VCBS repeat-containing protein
VYQPSDGARVSDLHIDAAGASAHGADPGRSILFPDKDLLFTASFKRSGADLLLAGPETTAVVLGYFKGERRLSLTTPEGASLKGEAIERLAGPDPPGRYAQAGGVASVLVPIGRVEKVSGSVTVMRNGILIDLHLGDTVAKGDVVQTGRGSSLTIKLNDGTVFSLSSSARMVLNDMVYAAGSTENTALFTLVQGLIGFIAGQVAKTGDLKVDTPVATMAIRGTAVRTEIAADSGVTRFSLLTEPDGRVGSILLLDKSNPSRVITSMSDARVATLLTPVSGSEPQITHITKTSDDIRSESDFVRDLFQFFSSGPRQRRGSSDFEDAPIVPVNLLQPVDATDQPQFAFVPFEQPRAAAASFDFIIPASLPTLELVRGTAIEDGPVARLDALAAAAALNNGAQPLVLVPASLPPGVRYLSDTRSFSLDPTHPAYQHLGKGETEIVTVEYGLILGDGINIPATVTWTVDGRNDAPVARNDRISTVEEVGQTTLAVFSNDSDVDGDSLRVVGWTSPLEGSVSLDAKGNFVFDPGDQFRALSRGETATVSFTYTVSDDNGGNNTATVTLQVQGEGTFSSPDQTASDADVLDFNNQPVSLTIDAPIATTTARADLELTIALGPVLQPQMNIIYLIDVSGSTSEQFRGAVVGDLNGDGRANTILDAEIASLLTLTERVRELGFSPADVTVTIIPFNDSADPTDGQDRDHSGLNAATFGLGPAGDGAIANYLKSLNTGGETNFADALRAANNRLQGLDQGGEANILYFLSDGRGQGAIDTELAILNDLYKATITALGVGEDASLSQLNKIDNTNGASLLVSPDEIDISVIGPPLPGGEIADLDVFVNGQEIVELDPDDLISTSAGLTLNFSADGLRRLAGDQNVVSAVVTFESGEVLHAELNIAGALPRSTDIFM